MKKLFIPICIVAIFSSIYSLRSNSEQIQTNQLPANSNCSELVVEGKFPILKGKSTQTLLCRTRYVTEYSTDKKTPIWVYQKLEKSVYSDNEKRVNVFARDPDVNDLEEASLKDYESSGFDRGHMASAANMGDNTKAMLESFYLTNMVPQNASNNRGIWKALEFKEREVAGRYGPIYVIDGPVYSKGFKTIGENHVAVPQQLFKILIRPDNKTIISFIIPNEKIQRYQLPRYITTLDNVQKQTDILFFPGVTEKFTESKIMW
ncbi:MAG: DNA/RNA non-specific endonuclease [Candidatus Nitrosotenuis sp.]